METEIKYEEITFVVKYYFDAPFGLSKDPTEEPKFELEQVFLEGIDVTDILRDTVIKTIKEDLWEKITH